MLKSEKQLYSMTNGRGETSDRTFRNHALPIKIKAKYSNGNLEIIVDVLKEYTLSTLFPTSILMQS